MPYKFNPLSGQFDYYETGGGSVTGTAPISVSSGNITLTPPADGVAFCAALTYGANVITGGTPSASSTYGGYPASNGCDGNIGTVWSSDGSAMPQWWMYDFGVGNAKVITKMSIYLPVVSTPNIALAGSNDNFATFTILIPTITVALASWVHLTFPNGISYQAVRVIFTGGAYAEIAEVQMFETASWGWVSPIGKIPGTDIAIPFNLTTAGSDFPTFSVTNTNSGAGGRSSFGFVNDTGAMFGAEMTGSGFPTIPSCANFFTTGTVNSLKFVTSGDVGTGGTTPMYFVTGGYACTPAITILAGNPGSVGIGVVSPTAKLHLPAGTATAGTAPQKFTAGTLLAALELGALEFVDDGTNGHLYITRNIAGVLTRSMIL
jgi:hypothetical protein